MSGVAIYVEGGGDGRETKDRLRRGMGAFLDPLRTKARAKKMKWKVVCSGARSKAYSDFLDAVSRRNDAVIALLVDSETEVTSGAREHLRRVDGWNLRSVPDDDVHLMVRTMETWIAADADALQEFYGQDFKRNALPSVDNLEDAAKDRIHSALKIATRKTRKGEYDKSFHGADLLARIDRRAVARRCPACKRMFDCLERVIEAA